LWKWCNYGIELTTLPCIRPDLRAHVNDTKLLSVMLDVLFDDVADFSHDNNLLERLIAQLQYPAASATFDRSELDYANFTKELWLTIQARCRAYPCFEAYRDLLHYDYLQLFNTMRFANLVNRQLTLLNLVEVETYMPHNMHMVISATLDLMCSPTIKSHELGRVRAAMWHAQCMGQIGNQMTTWTRELEEGDFTSGVFARAVIQGDVTIDELTGGNRAEIEATLRRGGHEEYLFHRWQDHRGRLLSMAPRIRSFDVRSVVRGLDRLMLIELGSRGRR
jgi:hypothetical protein